MLLSLFSVNRFRNLLLSFSSVVPTLPTGLGTVFLSLRHVLVTVDLKYCSAGFEFHILVQVQFTFQPRIFSWLLLPILLSLALFHQTLLLAILKLLSCHWL